MGLRLVQFVVGLLVATLLLGSAAAAAAAGGQRTTIIVGYAGTFEESARLIRGYGGQVTIAYRNIPAFAASVPPAAIGAIASATGIEFVEPDRPRYVDSHVIEGQLWTGTPQITPWGVTAVRAPQAWALAPSRGDGVRVAVLDTGFDTEHPDLAPNLLVSLGFDFVDRDKDVSDTPGPFQGHGSLTSGNIAAADNEIGVVGVAPRSDILPYRVCDSKEGICFTSAIIGGIDAAISNDARVISMSFGGPAVSIGERRIIRAAFLEGIVLVASAGNAGRPPVNFPAALPEVIAVGATDSDNRLARFSSFGHDAELVAPGVDVPSVTVRGIGREATLEQTAPAAKILHPNPLEFTNLTDDDGIAAPLAFAGRATDAEVASLDLTGKIALIERGDITFKEKVENVASKGAIGAVIYNNQPGNFFGTLQTAAEIPAVSLSREEGLDLKGQLDKGAAVSVTMVVVPSDYETASGTSFSAPHVSGVAALVIGANPALKGFEVRVLMDFTATDLGPTGYDRFYGFGLVNAEAAVAALQP